MKKLIYLFLLIGIILSTSCHENTIILPTEQPLKQKISNDFSISEESALAYLSDFIKDFEPTTRSNKTINIKSIEPMKFHRVASRTLQDSIDCNNLLYIANFENNQGYAILAGDERITDKIIAITDTGNIDSDELYRTLANERINRLIFDGYPMTGPGFYYTPDTGDELFMNPNTVDLYIDSIKDTLVGEFCINDIDAVDENGEPWALGIDSLELVDPISNTLCINYALEEIGNEFRKKDDLIPATEGSGGDSNPLIMKVDTTEWNIKSQVLPMLTNYSYWHQKSPFNDLYPTKRKYGFFGPRRRASAGCFPLAIAKLLTHFKTPNEFYYNGYLVNWNALNLNYNFESRKSSASHLLKGISDICNCWYFYGGTFTFPGKAANAMRVLGLNNAKTYRYSWDRVTMMLDKACPIIIYAMHNIDITSSHAWNIDGYKIKERQITKRFFLGGILQSEETQTESLSMVHCDFGWGGTSNGYYVSGIFNRKDSRIEYDANSTSSEKPKYNNYIHVVMYDKP